MTMLRERGDGFVCGVFATEVSGRNKKMYAHKKVFSIPKP